MIQGVEPRSGTKMIKGSVSVVASPLESSRYWLHSLMDICLFYALTPGGRLCQVFGDYLVLVEIIQTL